MIKQGVLQENSEKIGVVLASSYLNYLSGSIDKAIQQWCDTRDRMSKIGNHVNVKVAEEQLADLELDKNICSQYEYRIVGKKAIFIKKDTSEAFELLENWAITPASNTCVKKLNIQNV